MSDRELFLDTALRIGRRIAAEAIWSGRACTWTIRALDSSDVKSIRSVPETAGSGVYNGTAGIALFLAELHRHAPDPVVRRAAEGAVAFALGDAAMPRTQFSFHGGRVGTAYAAVRAGLAFGRDDLLEAAAAHLAPLAGHEPEEAGMDVVAGAAGAIPVLLRLAEVLDRDALLRMAEALGETLVAGAVIDPHGWCWGEGLKTFHARHLCGLAHGASGMGHALLELGHALGDARFRYGGQQAYAYERQFFDAAEGNWPDFRHPLKEAVLDGDVEALRSRAAAGDPTLTYATRYMSGWCHGAPGIGLARLRALALTGAAVYREEAEAAAENTRRMIETSRSGLNYSLCHGMAGNAVTLLHAARVLGRPDLRAFAEGVAVEGAERFEFAGRPWVCGTRDGMPDPGLMLGESGIGYFHLQLYADDTPCILLPTAPEGARTAERPESRAAAEARRTEDAEAYLARSLRVLAAAGTPPEALLPPMEDGARTGTVAAVRGAVRRRIAAEPDAATRARLADAFRVDDARIEMTAGTGDFCEEFVRGLLGADPRPADADAAEFRLPSTARVVRTAWDWDGAADGGEPAEQEAAYLLYLGDSRVRVRRLSPLAALVLGELAREPGSADVVAERIARTLDAEPGEALSRKVGEQLAHLHAARLVVRTAAPVPA